MLDTHFCFQTSRTLGEINFASKGNDLFDKSNFKNVTVLYGSSEPNLFNCNSVHF